MPTQQKIPLDATSVLPFTPPVLAETENPLVFILKHCTRRDREQLQDLLVEAGISFHGQDRIRDEVRTALRELWSPDAAEQELPRIEAYWDAADEYEREIKEAKDDAAREQIPPFEHPDMKHIAELEDRIRSAWAPLRRLAADNVRFNREQPRHLLRVALSGVEGKPDLLRREYGVVTEDSIRDLQDWLETDYGADVGQAAFVQLYAAALPRIFMLEGTEKNSKSPSPSTQTPATMKGDGSAAAKDGKFQASAPLAEIQEN